MARFLHPVEGYYCMGEKTFKDRSGAWFMDVEALHELEAGLKNIPCQVHRLIHFILRTKCPR